MKRKLLFQAIFLLLLASAQAQTTIHSGSQTPTSTNMSNRRLPPAQTNPHARNEVGNSRQDLKYRPRPDPVRHPIAPSVPKPIDIAPRTRL